jgi:plasmid stabilization system protein ParE
MTGYVLSIDADADLDDVWEYIAADDSQLKLLR